MAKKPPLKEEPLIVFLRLTGKVKSLMIDVCTRYKAHHNAIAEAGMLAELHRMDTAAPGVTAEAAKALADFQSLTGQDPVAVLTRLAREHHAETVPAA